MHSHLFTLIVLLQLMHIKILSPDIVATGLPHFSFADATSTITLCAY